MRRQNVRAGVLLAVLALIGVSGCLPQSHPAPLVTNPEQAPPDSLVIPGNLPWVDTGVDVTAGQAITITATGRVRITRLGLPKDDSEYDVGPQGTFLYGDTQQHHDFPLPAAGKGPAPCFGLLGRVGHGPAFVVGPYTSWVSDETGRLFLGINDFDPSTNQGEFYAQVHKPDDVQPASYRQEVPLELTGGGPAPGCSVVVFYIDGLRPDVVEEMAAMGHIPHLKRHFVEGGSHLSNTFTAFPSDTITSNGTMWTGCFSDRHGLKGQVRFSRSRLQSDSFLEPLGPNRSAHQLGPHGLDKAVFETEVAAVGVVQGPVEADRWRRSQTSAVPALYDYMRQRGQDWATGVLPIMTDMPPVLWTRSMTRFLPYLQAHDAWRYIDDANTHFALRHLIRQYRPVTVIWLPETDSVSHKECRGQFGSTRRTIARADKLVGEVTDELEAQGRLDSTYLILVSDHGHLGGQTTHLARFDLANELFFAPRQMSADRRWVGGGLGMSVRQHRLGNWHKGDTAKQFVFIDGDSDGAARIFLPRGSYRSGNWSGPPRPADLLAYRIEDHLEPINLVETLASANAVHDNGTTQHPVDLVLMKIGVNAILITTADRGQAVIERRRNDANRWEYRYTPVSEVAVTEDGGVAWRPQTNPQADPLNLTERVRRNFLRQYHDEQAWLLVTAGSDYPDGVVTLTRHMLWQEGLRVQEQQYAPDLVVTARYGWLFATQNTPGTTHGYPLAESVRATFYVSGPNVRRGARVQAPCRLADLTPTILELTGTDFDAEHFDGHALRNIYETAPRKPPQDGAPVDLEMVDYHDDSEPLVQDRPMYWRDFDLHAWQPLTYAPIDVYHHLPISINQSTNGWDLNNVAYNVLSIGDWSVFRLVDDVLSPLTPGRTKVNQSIEHVDRKVSRNRRPWVGDGVQALNVPGVALSDYSLTSAGNLKRVDRSVDWLQERGTRLDDKLASRTHHRSVLGAPAANTVIDTVQGSVWEVYRFAQRVLVQVLDEVVLNGIENGVDSTINNFRTTPREIIVEGP
ncbi:MAG: alkaline phosphatase family protein [Planctomycetales bacterium]